MDRTVRTPDGQTLAVEDAGDPAGRPLPGTHLARGIRQPPLGRTGRASPCGRRRGPWHRGCAIAQRMWHAEARPMPRWLTCGLLTWA